MTIFRITFSLFVIICLCSQNGTGQSLDFSDFEQIKARNIGPAGMSGRVTAIDVDLSNKNRIFLGTASGGVWLSENGGISWEPIFDDIPVLSIGALKINQSNPSEIWVGTGEGNPRNSQNSGGGVYFSRDAGKSWTEMGLKETKVIHRILLDETRPGTVYVGAQGPAWGDTEHRGVYKSTDYGSTWSKILYHDEGTGVGEMVMDPHNPNKLIVAMWEFRRSPWFFNSGGPGSSMQITYDGGATWKMITSEEGLPKGDLGRMGLAISPSNPNTVYALIEAKENALYKSFDGGETWKKHSTHDNIGNRPFYYYEIYVDPSNENQLYSIWSYVSKSEDGGKTFEVIADYGNNVHPDHHAFWIDPDNPDYLIDGNDGGANISYDGGDNWRFINNLPVGQFYHVDVDDDFPYNVYGGMQDNGSWVGPAFALKSGGITNYDWQEVYFGDGFDVAPKPDDNRYVYAMSQGGNIGLVDKKTGAGRFVKPNHPDSVRLRFNWNAALALEPGSDCGLYYGSQFLHYSDDCGKSWKIMSPDLTTNDTSKQHQDISGGLTIDATNAENNTTIIAIAPSSVDRNVIWVGSDDGRLHITTDGGTTWTDIYNRLPGAPRYGWIPQIEINDVNAGEAFVVVNNYRLNDWSAYLYHTTNHGRTWKRIVDDRDVTSFVTSVVQDEVEPNLLFLGTDAGLYISVDKGTNWSKWENRLPSVQIRDLKIQKSFSDLVLGTFGRAFWVMDDIGPFRAFANENYTTSDFDVISVSPAYLTSRRSYQGIRFIGQSEFQGDNRRPTAMFSIWVKPDQEEVKKEKGEAKKDKKKLKFHVLDSTGDTVRTFSRNVDKKGLIRTSWSLESNGIVGPSRRDRKDDADPPFGISVLPGDYKVIVEYGDHKDSIMTNVKMDPRLDLSEQDIRRIRTLRSEYDSIIKDAKESFDKIKKAKKSLALAEKLIETIEDTTKKELAKLTKSEKKNLENLEELFFNKENQKGIQRNPNNLMAIIGTSRRYIGTNLGAPGPNAEIALDKAKNKTTEVTTRVNSYFENDWKAFKERIDSVDFSIF